MDRPRSRRPDGDDPEAARRQQVTVNDDGERFTVECPTGSGRRMTLFEVTRDTANRLTRSCLGDASGRRPVDGGTPTAQVGPRRW